MPHRPGPRRVAALTHVDVVGGGVQRWWRQEHCRPFPGRIRLLPRYDVRQPGRRVQLEGPRVLVQRRADELPGQLRGPRPVPLGIERRDDGPAGRGAGAPWPTSSSPRRPIWPPPMRAGCSSRRRSGFDERARLSVAGSAGIGATCSRTSSPSCTTRSSSRIRRARGKTCSRRGSPVRSYLSRPDRTADGRSLLVLLDLLLGRWRARRYLTQLESSVKSHWVTTDTMSRLVASGSALITNGDLSEDLNDIVQYQNLTIFFPRTALYRRRWPFPTVPRSCTAVTIEPTRQRC